MRAKQVYSKFCQLHDREKKKDKQEKKNQKQKQND